MIICANNLEKLPGIRHGFFTREGGVSTGIYKGLNCGPGSNDDPDHVFENRNIVAANLGVAGEDLCSLYQVHGSDVMLIQGGYPDDQRPQADGMVTTTPGVALGILTADCAPVLFAEPETGVIGAAHAGWRGALDGVTDMVIEAMMDLGARRSKISAVVGPCISQESYEVGPEFPQYFLDEDAANQEFFIPAARADHFLFNLSDYVHMRLAEAGVGQVESLGLDTGADEARFFSYRRATHRGEPDYGRQISAIALAPALN
ncbi:MAG: peptidoglycan editing factor PgeF [Alphaproteobacteria bacterium]|jgi:polyphenol oxidase|nr:peptidoglycan editing factor PgeF [Alphaproteobacteria bacterium]MBT4964851.1 peptidoglycan editing factor PgeF [Alphaproteobacteria bacterium]MBT5159243.1 peptidoglycan editing factor PgeF [Alphaproteobacteria bacterium]MBT5917329.1 peptidoglycan editing factor PgeF [Alphaproteobacteria bacterium]MBT6384241.1 peptidoglycan editing factor PgeF [Alphaproteobacteria bacterium]